MAFNAGGAVQGGIGGASAGSAFGPWGAAIGGVAGGLAGGFLGGGNESKKMQREAWDRQELWMKNQLQWRVLDGQRAGLHPLAAIGSNVSAPTAALSIGDMGDSSVGESIGRMGQGIGRAASALMGPEAKYQSTLRALQIERGEMENAMLRFQLQQMHTQAGSPPSFPDLAVGESFVPVGEQSPGHRYPSRGVDVGNIGIPGQPFSTPPRDVGPVEMKAAEMLTNVPGSPGQEAGVNPDYQLISTGHGQWTWKPASHYQIDDLTSPGWFSWQVRNTALPALGYMRDVPKVPVSQWPEGTKGFRYDPVTGRIWAINYWPAEDDRLYFISPAEMVGRR